MWKPEHRRAAERKGLRYPNDLTDEEWALIAPLWATRIEGLCRLLK